MGMGEARDLGCAPGSLQGARVNRGEFDAGQPLPQGCGLFLAAFRQR